MKFRQLNKTIFVFLITAFCFLSATVNNKEQHIKVVLREIGNEFLFQLGDSTSRILAIEKEGGRFALKFENEFSFEPDLLSFSVFKTFEDFNITDSYIIETQNCDSNLVIHSFSANLISDKNEIACKLRLMPDDCYVFYFTVLDKNFTRKVTGKSNSSYWFLIIPLVFVIFLFFYFKNKKNQNLDSDEFKIGDYLFNKKEMTLSLNDETSELSSKETDLIYLLFTNENKTLEREKILSEVWGDEGNYVGRTLDVFISKIRKKFEADTRIKIINVRGVGYKMVIS